MFKFTVYVSDQEEIVTARSFQQALGYVRAFEARGYYCSLIEQV